MFRYKDYQFKSIVSYPLGEYILHYGRWTPMPKGKREGSMTDDHHDDHHHDEDHDGDGIPERSAEG